MSNSDQYIPMKEALVFASARLLVLKNQIQDIIDFGYGEGRFEFDKSDLEQTNAAFEKVNKFTDCRE